MIVSLSEQKKSDENMKQITFEQYRSLDLMIWTVITVVFEAITTLATNKWFYAQPVAMSITLTLICITMMRWNTYAVIPAVAGGFIFSLVSGATFEQYIIYCIGNVFALVAFLVIKMYNKEILRGSAVKLSLFVITAYIGMSLGRWLVSLFFGGDLMAFLVYITTDIISLLFAVSIMNLLRKADGMIEDQKAYLFRVQEEEEENSYEEDGGILL